MTERIEIYILSQLQFHFIFFEGKALAGAIYSVFSSRISVRRGAAPPFPKSNPRGGPCCSDRACPARGGSAALRRDERESPSPSSWLWSPSSHGAPWHPANLAPRYRHGNECCSPISHFSSEDFEEALQELHL